PPTPEIQHGAFWGAPATGYNVASRLLRHLPKQCNPASLRKAVRQRTANSQCAKRAECRAVCAVEPSLLACERHSEIVSRVPLPASAPEGRATKRHHGATKSRRQLTA